MKALFALALATLACADTGVFWHLTDAHFQSEYKQHTSAILACVEGIGTAGKYGAYVDCDLPIATLRGAFEMMSSKVSNPDFFLWTGDISPHRWKTPYDAEWSFGYQRNVSTLIREFFPVASGVPVIPVLGNHDPNPQHQMYPGKSEFYVKIAELWKDILPAGAAETFVQGGFYSTMINPTLRGIVLNTAIYYIHNEFVNNTDTVDLAGQLGWLKGQLKLARANKERVMMFYHVPAGGWPLPLHLKFGLQMKTKLNDMFVRAFNGYHDLISAHFCGHTHTDEFRFLTDSTGAAGQESVLLIAPSLTEAEYLDPRLRLMSYNRDYPHNVIGYDQYRLSITESNKNDRMDWFVEYNFNKVYGVDEFTPATARKVWSVLESDVEMQKAYMSRIRGFDLVGTVCEDVGICTRAFMCAINSSYIADVEGCRMK